jgi:hypothetical protein
MLRPVHFYAGTLHESNGHFERVLRDGCVGEAFDKVVGGQGMTRITDEMVVHTSCLGGEGSLAVDAGELLRPVKIEKLLAAV